MRRLPVDRAAQFVAWVLLAMVMISVVPRHAGCAERWLLEEAGCCDTDNGSCPEK